MMKNDSGRRAGGIRLWVGLVLGAVGVWQAAAASAGVIYVKADAGGANSGTSWGNAYTDLRAALAAAGTGDEIWVAAGTYKPTSGTNRTIAFTMKNGVALYGGFAGTESAREQRDWQAHPTILSGDIGVAGDASDNTISVVIGSDLGTLDGFTVTGGNAIDGGGMYNANASPTVTNCIFSTNTAINGGGMYNDGASPVVTNCTFTSNTAALSQGDGGGGMYTVNGSPTVTGCTFAGNESGRNGAGMWTTGSPKIIGCTFLANVSSGDGGGLIIAGGAAAVSDCAFTSNSAEAGGGGLFNSFALPTITDCNFTRNISDGGEGGGLYHIGSAGDPTTMTGLTFIANRAYSGGGMFLAGGAPTVSGCSFSSNAASNQGGGSFNRGTETMADCAFTSNTAENMGGGMFVQGKPEVTRCIFRLNASPTGGGIYVKSVGTLTATECVFSGNTGVTGGGVCNGSSFSSVLTNCVFSGNSVAGSGSLGGGLYNAAGKPTLTNCTFYGNSAPDGDGGGIQTEFSTINAVNCILWQNSAASGAESSLGLLGFAKFAHCDIEGSGGSGAGWDATVGTDDGGNIADNPKFADAGRAAGLDMIWRTADDGLRLEASSPCIDAGAAAGAPAGDILGKTRGGAPDLGAYEYLAAAAKDAVRGWGLYR